jgi:hypothetical protein
MPKLVVALVIAMLPAVAIAQTTNSNPQDTQSVQPTRPNSGAGVAGPPGTRPGPPAKEPATTGFDANRPPQDTSNIPGKPGSKSGPVQRSPSK